jgi:hypothetical protein
MWERFIINMKISRLSSMVKAMEKDIFRYRRDMELMNDLYYCGRGDVDSYINEWSYDIYRKILACDRLRVRFERQLDRLDNVVGA